MLLSNRPENWIAATSTVFLGSSLVVRWIARVEGSQSLRRIGSILMYIGFGVILVPLAVVVAFVIFEKIRER